MDRLLGMNAILDLVLPAKVLQIPMFQLGHPNGCEKVDQWQISHLAAIHLLGHLRVHSGNPLATLLIKALTGRGARVLAAVSPAAIWPQGRQRAHLLPLPLLHRRLDAIHGVAGLWAARARTRMTLASILPSPA